LKDLILRKFLLGKKGNQRPDWQEIVSGDDSAKIYWSQWKSLVIENGIFYRRWETLNLKSHVLQIIVPRKRVKQILEEMIFLQADILELIKSWIEFENGSIGQLLNRMLKIDVEFALFV